MMRFGFKSLIVERVNIIESELGLGWFIPCLVEATLVQFSNPAYVLLRSRGLITSSTLYIRELILLVESNGKYNGSRVSHTIL